jgi:hypothetical protein
VRSVAEVRLCNVLSCRGVYSRIIPLAFFCALVGLLSSAQAQTPTYVQGLPTVGDSTSSVAAASRMSIDPTQFVSGADMCAKIALACAKLGASMPDYPKGATIDARGFTGNQACSAANATTMLSGCVTGTNDNGGKLLLGNVNLYIDGPIPPLISYTDGSSGVGTPAIIIPSMFWGIEGISRGATANGTNAGLGTFISPSPTTNPPTGCNPTTHPFPVRSFAVTSATVTFSTPTGCYNSYQFVRSLMGTIFGGGYLELSRMATFSYSSMGMARSGALSLLKSPEAMPNPP